MIDMEFRPWGLGLHSVRLSVSRSLDSKSNAQQYFRFVFGVKGLGLSVSPCPAQSLEKQQHLILLQIHPKPRERQPDLLNINQAIPILVKLGKRPLRLKQSLVSFAVCSHFGDKAAHPASLHTTIQSLDLNRTIHSVPQVCLSHILDHFSSNSTPQNSLHSHNTQGLSTLQLLQSITHYTPQERDLASEQPTPFRDNLLVEFFSAFKAFRFLDFALVMRFARHVLLFGIYGS
jgi:hypothetical protein